MLYVVVTWIMIDRKPIQITSNQISAQRIIETKHNGLLMETWIKSHKYTNAWGTKHIKSKFELLHKKNENLQEKK